MSLGPQLKPAGTTSAHCPFGKPVMSSVMSGYLNVFLFIENHWVSVIQTNIRIKEPADLGYLKKLIEFSIVFCL
jgi:hypothetical protein